MTGDDVDGTDPTQANPAGDAPTDLASDAPRRADAPDSLLGGVLAGRYRIDRRLGSGGMGAVYAGTHLLLDRPIAVKVIKPRFGDDPGIAQRFIQEARTASGIGHAHVVEITDFGETEAGTAYFVMERLEGEDLAATVSREGPLAWQRVVHVGEQIARALAAAHKHGIVHRDIKPANCFRLTRDDDPDYIKVLDFGLAKVVGASRHDDASLTQTGALLGTPGYIAPELYRGLAADHRVDIYALGALMHKLLTGELPPMRLGLEGPSELALSTVPPVLQAILRRALADDPAARYPTAQALASDLRRLAAGTGVSLDPGSDPPAASGPLLAVTRDARGLSFTIGAPLLGALLLSLGVFAFFSLRAGSLPPAEPVGVPAPPPALVAHEPPPPVAPPPAPAAPPVAPPTAPTPATPDPAPVAAPAAPLEPPAAPADLEPRQPQAPVAKPLRPGSPAAVQKAISRRCGGTFGYDVTLQWKADDDGRVIPGSVKALVGSRVTLNDAETCAVRQLARSELAWTPGETYTHKFKSG